MIKHLAFLMATVAFLGACGASAPPRVAVTPEIAQPAHQAQENPKPPMERPAPGKKSTLSFDVPPAWTQVPDANVRTPWKMEFINAEARGTVLMDFDVVAEGPAAQVADKIVEAVCKTNGWTCSKPKPLASGDGAAFTFTSASTKGKIAVRDLNGEGAGQIQLFGEWAKAKDAQAVKDFDTMISTAKID